MAYKCANCLRPLFSGLVRKDMLVDEFPNAAPEEFLFFKECYGVDVSTECVSFNGNMLSVATCGDCEEELGYYLVEVRTFVYMKWEPNTFCVRSKKVEAMAQARYKKLTEFVENKVLNALSQTREPLLAAVFDAASEVGKFVEGRS